jgi:hypothetical protein
MQANTRLDRRSNVAVQQNNIQRKKKRLAESAQAKCDWLRVLLGDAPLTLWGTGLHLLQHSETTTKEFALSQLLNGVELHRPTLWLHGKIFNSAASLAECPAVNDRNGHSVFWYCPS